MIVMNTKFLLLGLFGIVLISACVSGFNLFKPTCELGNQTCQSRAKDILNNCENYVLWSEDSTQVYTIDITRNPNTCNVIYTIQKSIVSGMKGLSMTCDTPFNKMYLHTSVNIELFKYCEGSLKDNWFNQWSQVFGISS
jgi:hypothetical protein